MKRSFVTKMSFASGGAKVGLDTTITKDGQDVNPATLSKEMLAFCAKLAANKARALNKSIVGFTGSSISVELPDTIDESSLSSLVEKEVEEQLSEIDTSIEMEAEETDYVAKFATNNDEVIDPLEDDNEAEVEDAINDTDKVDPLDTSHMEVAEDAAENAADPTILDVDKAKDDTGLQGAAGGGGKVEVTNTQLFTAKDVTGKTHTFSAKDAGKSMFDTVDKTVATKSAMLAKMK